MSTSEASAIRHNEDLSRYEIVVDGALAGFADVVRDGDTARVTHTEIADDFGGRGLGSALVRGTIVALDEAGIERVVPQCPFVKSWLDKHPEFDRLWR